jgi:hypothetical protein
MTRHTRKDDKLEAARLECWMRGFAAQVEQQQKAAWRPAGRALKPGPSATRWYGARFWKARRAGVQRGEARFDVRECEHVARFGGHNA